MTKTRAKDLPLAQRSPWRNRMLKAEAELAKRQWQPIETAPHDHRVLVYAPGREGLPPIMCTCEWHPDAGFCVDELRSPTHWMPLPEAPK